jgi:pheromone a factor receptor
MSIYHLYKRQGQLSEVISSGCGMSRSLYIRLMMISGIEILGTIPLASLVMANDIEQGLTPWVSWADVHSSYSEIEHIPNIVWKHLPHQALGFELFRWSLVLCAFIFFAFFGFAEEARKNYRRFYSWLANLFGYSTSSGTSITPV